MSILAFLSVFVAFFIYFCVIWIMRLDFRKRFTISLFDTIGAPIGLLSSILAVVGCVIGNITLLVTGYSVAFSPFAILIVSNGLSFREQIFSNKTVDIITKIVGVVFGGIGIIFSIIIGQIL